MFPTSWPLIRAKNQLISQFTPALKDMAEEWSGSLKVGYQDLPLVPELYLSWTSFTRVTLADRLKIPSISKADRNRAENRKQRFSMSVLQTNNHRLPVQTAVLSVPPHETHSTLFLALPCSDRKLIVSLITTGTR